MTMPIGPVTIGRRALRDIAFVKDANNLINSGEILYNASVGDNIQLEMLKSAHGLPTEAPTMLTGMINFTPNISVFEPGDEDVGRFANAYDQTITHLGQQMLPLLPKVQTSRI